VQSIVSETVDFSELPAYLAQMAENPQKYVKVVGVIGEK